MMQNPGIPGRSILAEDSPGFIRHATYVEAYDPTLTTFGRQTQEPQRLMRVYNGCARALVKGEPLVVQWDGDEEFFPKVIVPAATTAPDDNWPAIALEVTADLVWCWVVIEGYCDALVLGSASLDKDDFLKMSAAGTASLIVDGATKTADSVAIATETQTTVSTILKKIYLLGERMVDVD
jgi:hypothetical protein